MAAMYIIAGTLHFALPGPYQRIVPPYLGHAGLLVALSGVAEIAGGAGLLFDRTRRAAAVGIILLLTAVFPANLYMATHPGIFPGIPQWALWLRLPLQLPLMVWAGRYMRQR